MLYQVFLDGESILDFSDPELVLLSPHVEGEIDTTGSFEFTVPPNHKYYTRFSMESIMSMTIEVYEGNVQHFFGRPIELHLDFYKNKKIYCEGAMGYFNDSVQRKKEYDEGTYLSEFFTDVIQRHNEMVEESRQFQIEQMTVPDHQIYRKIDFEQTADVLKSKLLDAEEGHFFLERRNGVNYISFLRDDVMPYECNQTAEFAKNLLNFTYSFDGKDFATCVLPLGATISESDGGTGEPLTIASVNDGSDILVGNSAANYGQIIKAENYSDIRTPTELLAEAQKYLTKLQYNAMVIECSAVDLHGTDPTKTPFRLGQMVHCVSDPHGIDTDLPLSKISLYLDSAAKQITLGRIPKKTLSRFYKEEASMAGRSSGGGTGGGASEGVDPGWYIVYPEDSGGTPSMNKSPVRMKISQMPIKTEYDDGETIDFTGMVCTLLSSYSTAAEEVIFSDERYPGGIIPFSELIFSPTVMPTNPKISNAQFVVKWKNPYKKNSTFACSFILTNKTRSAEEAAAIAQHGSAYPDHIQAVAAIPTLQTYKNGQYIHLDGVVVQAFYPDGSLYDGSGYTQGKIPKGEIILGKKIANMDDADSSIYSDGDQINALCITAVPYYVNPNTGKTSYRGSAIIGRWQQGRPCTVWFGEETATILLTRYGNRVLAARISGSSLFGVAALGEDGWEFVGGTNYRTMLDYFTYATWTEYFTDLPISRKEPRSITDLKRAKAVMTVPVSWKSPNGDILTSSFNISIENDSASSS